jgi:hypothetical protein
MWAIKLSSKTFSWLTILCEKKSNAVKQVLTWFRRINWKTSVLVYGYAINTLYLMAISGTIFFVFDMNRVPVKLKGYRIGTDNIAYVGKEVQGLVLIERDASRTCSNHVRLTLQDSQNSWSSTLYDLNASPEAVRQANLKTPGEFYFNFTLPQNTPLGSATIVGDADFSCSDNPLHAFWPARLNPAIIMKITVQN